MRVLAVITLGLSIILAGCATNTDDEKPAIFQLGDCLTSDTNVTVGSTYELSIYVIAQGDTLAKIAKRFQIKIKDLRIMNPNLNLLKVGQPILVDERPKY
jgi:LysM repeat protein